MYYHSVVGLQETILINSTYTMTVILDSPQNPKTMIRNPYHGFGEPKSSKPATYIYIYIYIYVVFTQEGFIGLPDFGGSSARMSPNRVSEFGMATLRSTLTLKGLIS